jgi:DNA-binding PadR family transcriptional regulator
MSSIDLILLGIVADTPRSAYEIQKHVEYRNLSKWVKISTPSIYKKVLRLEEAGYLASQTLREGRMPEKAVYSITPSGRAYFESLMARGAREPVEVLFDFNAVVANLNKLPKDQALLMIDSIRRGIHDNLSQISSVQPQRAHIPLTGRAVMDQQIRVLEALSAWADKFHAQYEREGSERTGELPEQPENP